GEKTQNSEIWRKRAVGKKGLDWKMGNRVRRLRLWWPFAIGHRTHCHSRAIFSAQADSQYFTSNPNNPNFSLRNVFRFSARIFRLLAIKFSCSIATVWLYSNILGTNVPWSRNLTPALYSRWV